MKNRISSMLLAIFMLWQTIMTCGIQVYATSVLEITSPSDGEWISYLDAPDVEWDKVDGAAGYRVSIRNTITNDLLVENKWTTKTYYSLDGKLDKASSTYKVWVGAMSSKSDAGSAAFTSDTITLYTKAEAPSIEDEDYNDTTYNSVVLSMNITKDNGSAITDSGFYVVESGLPTSEKETYSFKRYGSYSATTKGYKEMTISGLKPDTKYYYYAYAINGIGETITSRHPFTTEEYDCPHNSGVYTNTYPESVSYINIDDSTQHKEIWYYNEYCNYCEEVVETKAVTETYYKNHTWSDDVCKYCKYALACQHKNTYTEYYDTSYTDITETTHTRNEWYHIFCQDCDEQLEDNKYFWDSYEDEKHTFKNDICTGCSYERYKELSVGITIDTQKIFVGEKFTAYANADGGSGSYIYAFSLYRNGSLLDQLAYDNARDMWSVTATEEGTYQFKVTVVDGNDKEISKYSDEIEVVYEKDEYIPDPIDISTTTLTFTESAGNEEFSIYSSDKWTASVTVGASWLSIDRSSGYENKDIIVSVLQNTSSSVRTGEIKVSDSTGTKYVTVTQNAAVAEYLTVSTSDIVAGAEKTIEDGIKISSNSDWTISSSASWIVASVGNGKYDASISVTIHANSTTTSRTGYLTFTCGSIVKKVKVTQEGAGKPSIKNFIDHYTVTVDEKFNISGIVTAANGGKLNKITIKRYNYYSNDNTLISVLANNSNTYDLSKLASFNVAANPINNEVGTYTYVIFASADNYTTSNNEIGRFTVTVKEAVVEDASVALFDCEVTENSASIRGQIASLGGKKFEKCGVYLYNSGKTLIDTVTITTYPQNNTGVYTANFYGLTPGTKYYFRYFLVAGGDTYISNGYTQLITNGVTLDGFQFTIENAYFSKPDEIIIATAGEPFQITLGASPADAVIKSSKCIPQSMGGISVSGTGNTYKITVNEANTEYYVDFTVYGTDGSEFKKSVMIYAFYITGMNLNYKGTSGETQSIYVEYSDQFFGGSSYDGYRHELAKLSLGLCVSAFTANDGEETQYYDTVEKSSGNSDYIARIANISDAYRKLGIVDDGNNIKYYLYEESLNSAEHNVAYSIAKKSAVVDGEDCTILFVVLRGGGYGSEWASNFVVGDKYTYSEAFDEASWIVYSSIWEYIKAMTEQEKSNMKILLTGYSRAAATANLTAAKLIGYISENPSSFGLEDIYAYTFATPLNVKTSLINTQMTRYGESVYDNIYNIINPGDVVPTVPLREWGFTRYGQDCYFPIGYTKHKINGELLYDIVDETYSNEIVKHKDSYDSYENTKMSDVVSKITYILAKLTGNLENYNAYYQTLINKMLHACFYKTQVTAGYSWEPVGFDGYAYWHDSFSKYSVNSVNNIYNDIAGIYYNWILDRLSVAESAFVKETIVANEEMIRWAFTYMYMIGCICQVKPT